MAHRFPLEDRWHAACVLLGSVHDVLHGRPVDEAPPPWCAGRSWDAFLGALGDADVARWERGEHSAVLTQRASTVPPSLRVLAQAVDAACALPAWERVPALPPRGGSDRRASERKRAQVQAFADAARPLAAGRARVVDVGSGHGHLTRELAAAFGLPSVGVERDSARVRTAAALVGPRAHVVFQAADVFTQPLALRGDDLAVGLHACGELGDMLVCTAAETGAALALVPCCPQKRRARTRAPLAVPPDVAPESLTLERAVLGLANVAARDAGVEVPLGETMEARRRRVMAMHLLHLRGVMSQPGEEMRGVNRRRAWADDASYARDVFAVRHLPPPTDGELHAAQASSQRAFNAQRRWALPRNMLGRLLEVTLLLDRARYLQVQGYRVNVGEAFASDVSPRNLMLLAER